MPRRPDVPCSKCGTLIWRGTGSLANPVCQPCRRALRPKPLKEPAPTRQCVHCQRAHRGARAVCYKCRRPGGWKAPLSGDSMSERVEQARQRTKWKPLVDAGRAYCQQGIAGNGSSGTCVEPSRRIRPGTRWAVGHSDDRRHRIGPVHHRCNLLDAARRGGIAKKAKYGHGRGGAVRMTTDRGRNLAL